MAVVIPAALSVQETNRLAHTYQKGKIIINADPHFGQGTDWESLYLQNPADLVLLPDGSLFTISGDGQLIKFSPEGRLAGIFSQNGQGPGDLYLPVNLSLLDNRFIVVGEYATSRRISLFRPDGTFAKVLKARHPAFQVTALKNGKIAYIANQYHPTKNSIQEVTKTIISKDIETGEEREIISLNIEYRFLILKGGIHFHFRDGTGDIHIARTGGGDLLIGNSYSGEMSIYSPEGEMLRRFSLQIEPVPVTKNIIRQHRDHAVQTLLQQTQAAGMADQLKKADFDVLFLKSLPYYVAVHIDSKGNILVFKNSGCLEDCTPIFQAYTEEGAFINEVTLDTGTYHVDIDSLRQNLIWTPGAVFGIFTEKQDPGEVPRVVKTVLESSRQK